MRDLLSCQSITIFAVFIILPDLSSTIQIDTSTFHRMFDRVKTVFQGPLVKVIIGKACGGEEGSDCFLLTIGVAR